MSSLADLPELIGFFSYSREDDQDSYGALSTLREHIQHELRGQLGRSQKTFRLWQDKSAIAPGKLWEAEIKAAVAQSVFFIPIITPTVVRSPYCRFELEAFLAREADLGRDDLVFPILYIRVPQIEDTASAQSDPVLSIITKRQYVDWRELRHRDASATEVKEAIAQFCTHIADALLRTWISPQECKAQEEAAALQHANERERERQEAEATHRDEEARQEREARERAAALQRAEEERKRQEAEAKRHDEEARQEREARERAAALQRAEEERKRQEAEAKRREQDAEERAASPTRRNRQVIKAVAGIGVLLLLGLIYYAFKSGPTEAPPVAPVVAVDPAVCAALFFLPPAAGDVPANVDACRYRLDSYCSEDTKRMIGLTKITQLNAFAATSARYDRVEAGSVVCSWDSGDKTFYFKVSGDEAHRLITLLK